jgi:serine/threonine protein kinase
MGNQQSFQQHLDFKDIATNYDYQRKFNDKRFGEIKLYKEKGTDKKIFQKDLSLNSPQEFEEQVTKVRDSAALAHPNLLRTYGYNSKKDEIFCADFYKLSIFFESFETDLEQEIIKRARNKEYFPETELWYLLYSIASASAYLQTNNVAHKDIRPYNVFITSDNEYKISAANPFRQGTEATFYENFERPESRAHNYSPESLKQITTALDKRTKYDAYRSDTFSLGLTLLEAGNLERPDVYDYERREVREASIHENLNKLRSRYSEDFVRTVESTLRVNPEHRLDFAILERELGVYRLSIAEKARGPGAVANLTPAKVVGGHQEQRTPGERVLRSAAPVHDSSVPTYPGYKSDDLDARVREAVIRSEAVIKRSSPTKHANSKLDPYIQQYLRNDLSKEHSLLAAISPHLTSESKYTTTLTIEQPNYGRESQPLNFGQDVPESVKKSSYVEPATHHSQVQTQLPATTFEHRPVSFGQPQPTVSSSHYYGTTTGAAADYGQVPTKLSQHGLAGQNYGTSHLTSSGLGHQTYGVAGQNLTSSGLGHQTYGGVTSHQTYGVAGGHQTYGGVTGGNLTASGLGNTYTTTNVHHSGTYQTAQPQKDYSHEADELTRRIAERLGQSKQQY